MIDNPIFARSYPKINIALKVGEKLSNNHEIKSRFHLRLGDLYDDIIITDPRLLEDPKNTENIGNLQNNATMQSAGNFYLLGNFDCDIQDNLIYKAYKLCQTNARACVYVNKRIKTGAGLGGGSSNAALCLALFNKIFKLKLDRKTLMSMAQKLGSDVSFFLNIYTRIQNTQSAANQNPCDPHPYFFSHIDMKSEEILEQILKDNYNFSQYALWDLRQKPSVLSANVSGRGEIIEPFYEEALDINIHANNIFCSTAAVFNEFDRLNDKPKLNLKNLDLKLDSKTLLSKYPMEYLNDLYIPASALYPKLKDIAKDISKNHKPFFSGSGSSFFTLAQ